MERLGEMTTFVKVVEAQGFGAAAHEPGISTAAVDKEIQRLEAQLGSRLMSRTTRRQALAEVGTVFFKKSRAILSEVEEAEPW